MIRRLAPLLLAMAFACDDAPSTDVDGTDTNGEVEDSDAAAPAEPDLENGARVYNATCAVCHGDDGAGLGNARDLREALPEMTDDEVEDAIRNGAPGMPPFRSTLSDADIIDVIAYIRDSFED